VPPMAAAYNVLYGGQRKRNAQWRRRQERPLRRRWNETGSMGGRVRTICLPTRLQHARRRLGAQLFGGNGGHEHSRRRLRGELPGQLGGNNILNGGSRRQHAQRLRGGGTTYSTQARGTTRFMVTHQTLRDRHTFNGEQAGEQRLVMGALDKKLSLVMARLLALPAPPSRGIAPRLHAAKQRLGAGQP